MYIRKLNFQSRSELIDKKIEYKNEFAILDNDGKVIIIIIINKIEIMEY